MIFTAALSIITTAINTLIEVEPTIVKTIGNLKPYANALYHRLTGKELTDDERIELENKIDELHAEFQAPIPPEDQQ